MKFKLNILVLLILGESLFFLSTCKQPGTNPCAGAKEPTAAFTMEETGDYVLDTAYDTDTVYGPGAIVNFSALEQDAKYEWKIGTDSFIHTQRSFNLDFSSYYGIHHPNVPPVTVTLKVTKYPGSCFNASDSVHYMSRTLYFANKSLIPGKYQGKFSFDSSSIKTIQIIIDTIIPPVNQTNLFIGFPGKDSKIYSDTIVGSNLNGTSSISTYYYRQASMSLDPPGPEDNYITKVKIMVTPDNKHIFMWIKPYLTSSFTFYGTRIK